jgi:dienelactone hydrolase
VWGIAIWLGLTVLIVTTGCVDAVYERTVRPSPPGEALVSSTSAPGRNPAPAPPLVLRPHAQDDGYETYAFSMPSSGDNGQPGHAVTGWYFKQIQVRAPLVIVVPIYGTMAYPSWTMARFLVEARTRRAMNVVLVEAVADLTDWNRLRGAPTEEVFLQAVAEGTGRYRTAAEDISRIIDWAVTRPETDPEGIGIVGFSLSATIAAIAMTQDGRLSAGAFLMGGAHLHEVFAYCGEARVAEVRQAVTARFGWSVDTFKVKIQPISDAINPALMPSVNGHRRTLYVEATDDDYIPRSARDALRATLSPSVHIRLGYRHWPAFLRGMSPLGLHYLERAVVRFFEDAFAPPRESSRARGSEPRSSATDARSHAPAGAERWV